MSSRYRKPLKKYSRPGYKACGKMVYGDAKKALLVARGVRRLLNVEIKNFDTQQTSVAISDTVVITQLTNIPQGDTTSTRDGNQIKMLGVNINYTLITNATLPRTAIRIMLVIDKQTNQSIYGALDLLEDVTSQDNIISPRNLNNLHRFQVLYDRVHMVSLSSPTVTVRKYIKKDLLIRYDASTSAIADLTQSSLSLVQVSSEVTNDPNITSFIRVRYVDN